MLLLFFLRSQWSKFYLHWFLLFVWSKVFLGFDGLILGLFAFVLFWKVWAFCCSKAFVTGILLFWMFSEIRDSGCRQSKLRFARSPWIYKWDALVKDYIIGPDFRLGNILNNKSYRRTKHFVENKALKDKWTKQKEHLNKQFRHRSTSTLVSLAIPCETILAWLSRVLPQVLATWRWCALNVFWFGSDVFYRSYCMFNSFFKHLAMCLEFSTFLGVVQRVRCIVWWCFKGFKKVYYTYYLISFSRFLKRLTIPRSKFAFLPTCCVSLWYLSI